MVDDIFFMQKAIDIAWPFVGLTYPNPAVGAVIVDKDKNIISTGVHKAAFHAHAELEAVKNALVFYNKDLKNIQNPNELHSFIINNFKNFFKDHTIYVTLEPCNHYGKTPPCSLLLKEMGFKRVVVATLDKNKEASGGVEYLKSFCEVKVGVLEKEAKELLLFFNIWQKKKPFLFFKIAVSKNDVYTGGIISSKKSRELVHRLREVTDLLVIGGKTIRVDRPRLDTRLVNGKNPPDVLIVSKEKNFDKNIPLFNIKNRKVFIENDLKKVNDFNFVMVEGGKNFFKFIKDKLDAIIIFRSDFTLEGEKFLRSEELKDFKRLKKFKYFDDTIEWKVKKDHYESFI